MNYYYVVFLVYAMVAAENCDVKSPCASTRIKKLLAADCFNRNLNKVPQCLRSSTEVLDLTYNRIRRLMKDDLSRYSDLKILYLNDNMIGDIDEDAFLNLEDLTVLDLSLNSIIELPPKIFNLPSLNKLFLSQNQNMNIIDAVEQAKPISAPIVTLDISFNELEFLPDFGLMVNLIEYNISGNNLKQLTPTDFAGMCNLKYLYHDNMTVEFRSECDCVKLNLWLTKRHVEFKPFLCKVIDVDCVSNAVLNQPDLVLFESCKASHEELVMKTTMLKFLLPAVVVLLLVICAVIYYFLRKRKQTKINNRKNAVQLSNDVENKLLYR